MKLIIPAALILLCATASGYGGAFQNLQSSVSDISAGDFEFSMNHRFIGAAMKDDPLDSFFGLDDGANVRFGLRYFPINDLYIGFTHTRFGHMNTITAGWEHTISLLNTELGAVAGYSSLKMTSNSDWEGGIVATIYVSAWFLSGRIRPVFNYAFDGYQDESGPGLGLEISATGKISLMGEFFPYTGNDDPEDCFSFSGSYSTWGHQFMLGFTNSASIGPQGQLSGSSTSDLSVALSIRRLL
ncbi:MAG: DUF5777 family beta-barrel protein [Candidatus Fermentibacteria bacterium]